MMLIRQDDEQAGPWGVYDEYCLSCSTRGVGIAPVESESVDLWECPNCGEMTLTHHPYPDEEEAEA